MIKRSQHNMIQRIKLSFSHHYQSWGADPNCFLIRPNQAHIRVLPDQKYRVWSEVRAQYSPDHGLKLVWSGVKLSEKSDHRRIRVHLSLIINGSSSIGSDQGSFRLIYFLFSCFLLRYVGLAFSSGNAVGQVFEHKWVWSGTISSALFV